MKKELISALSALIIFLAVIFISMSWLRDVHLKALTQGPRVESQENVSEAEVAAALVEQKQAAAQLTRSATFDQRFRKLSLVAQQRGSVPVILKVRAAYRPEGRSTGAAQRLAQRQAIRQAQDELVASLPSVPSSLIRYKYLPYLALTLDTQGLAQLLLAADVLDLFENKTMRLATSDSLPLVGAPRAWASEITGAGQTIALLDSGVDKNHPRLAHSVVSEACFSTNDPVAGYSSLCPGAIPASTDVDSGLPCTVLNDDLGNCKHGTHIAGIAAGGAGVAYNARLISIQVMSLVTDQEACRGQERCLLSRTSDVINALNRVYDLRATFDIAAVNISLASDGYASHCDDEFQPMRDAIELLKSVGIASVIAAGNDFLTDSIGYPACISSAISVGATGDGSASDATADAVMPFSNSAPFLNLLAPGNYITSTVPGGGFAGGSGTSMAAAHVSGAWALLKERFPAATVDDLLNRLTTFGVTVTDSRNRITKPRIRVDDALQVTVPPDNWVARYYNNTDLTGDPVIRRDEGGGFLDRDFAGLSPAPGLDPENYSISWTRTLSLLAGNYRFSLTGDDGVRLFIDGVQRINQWTTQPATTYNIEIDLSSGKHELRVEYYHDSGPAQLRLNWEAVNTGCSQTVAADRWRAEYFNNMNLAGSPVLVRDEGVVDIGYDWGDGGPASPCYIFPDRFSARWTRRANFLAATYTFTVTNIDDGVRLFVDGGAARIDRWLPAAGTYMSISK